MKQITYIASSTIGVITLVCLQLCLLKYEHTINCNLVLIAYMYALFAPLPSAIIGILILILDALNFLMTGYFGYLSIILTTTSLGFIAIKDNFYNKLIMPIVGIVTYFLLQLLILNITVHYATQIPEFIFAIITNSLLFVIVWWSTNQPLHD